MFPLFEDSVCTTSLPHELPALPCSGCPVADRAVPTVSLGWRVQLCLCFWKGIEAADCLCPMALASGLASGCSHPPALNTLSQRLLQFPPGCLRPGGSCRMLLCWGPPGPHLQPLHRHLSPPIHLLPSFGSVCSMIFIGAN